jgi:hypothetical protein
VGITVANLTRPQRPRSRHDVAHSGKRSATAVVELV